MLLFFESEDTLAWELLFSAADLGDISMVYWSVISKS